MALWVLAILQAIALCHVDLESNEWKVGDTLIFLIGNGMQQQRKMWKGLKTKRNAN